MNKLFISIITLLSICTNCSNVATAILHLARVEIVEEKDTIEYSINGEAKDSIVSHEGFDTLIGKSWVIGGDCFNLSTPRTCTIHIKRTNLNINKRGYYVSFKNTGYDTASNVKVKIKVKNNGKEYFKDVAFLNQMYFGYISFGIAWLDTNEKVIPPAKISWDKF